MSIIIIIIIVPSLKEDQSRFLDMFCVIIIIAILDHADVLMCMSYVSGVVNSGRVSKLLYIFSVYMDFLHFQW